MEVLPVDLSSGYYRHVCISFRFRCEDPLIKVKISNLISFVCPVYDLRPYLDNYLDANGEIFESLYFVDDNFTAYNTCDARSKIIRVTCDARSKIIRVTLTKMFIILCLK